MRLDGILCFCAALALGAAACDAGGSPASATASDASADPAGEAAPADAAADTAAPSQDDAPTGDAPAGDDAVTADTAAPEPPAPPPILGPPLAADEDPDPDVVEVTLVAYPAEVELFPGTKTLMWTYNGQVPGPRIEAKVGDRIVVHFTNRLSKDTTVHWHGMRVPNAMDGSPMTQPPIEPYGTFDYDFVATDAGTFWYHPHMSTHMAVERGLYAPLVVREAEPPAYDRERVLVLDDVLLDDDGQISPSVLGHMETMHGRFGNTLLVNGRPVGDEPEVWQVRRGSVERWRILNAANARAAELDIPGADWRVVGTDGGLLPEPYSPGETLRVAPGERYEIEVRFEPHAADSDATLRWHVPALDGDQVVDLPVGLARLVPTAEEPLPSHGVALPVVTLPDWTPAAEPTLLLEVTAANGAGGKVQWMFNGASYDPETMIDVPLGAMQTLDVINTTAIEHPFHVHGHFFQVASRNGQPTAEPGLKDTVWIGPNDTVRLVLPFDNPGVWMVHCHILEHAEAGMMTMVHVK